MTQEEKAKAYDEAIKRAEALIKVSQNQKEVYGCIMTIFPELKKSEDERTRKGIIELVKQSSEVLDKQNQNNMIAWLEKQGEYKRFDYENANIQQKDFAPQKDIPRYSIGDVLCDKSCTTLNKDSQPNFEITDIRNGMYICDKCSFPISQQDEYELVAKRIEQKPAWSEEDEEIALSIEQVMNCASLLNIVPEKIDKIRTWLKSLKDRCAWKPSEEQLDALKRTQTGVIQFSVLQSLYNDLKKL